MRWQSCAEKWEKKTLHAPIGKKQVGRRGEWISEFNIKTIIMS